MSTPLCDRLASHLDPKECSTPVWKGREAGVSQDLDRCFVFFAKASGVCFHAGLSCAHNKEEQYMKSTGFLVCAGRRPLFTFYTRCFLGGRLLDLQRETMAATAD